MQHSNATKPIFEAITHRLPVSDIDRALAFYCDQLGFQLGWKWGSPVTHANVCRDSISLDLIASRSGGRGPAMVYVQLSGVDSYFAQLKGLKVELGELSSSIRMAIASPSGSPR